MSLQKYEAKDLARCDDVYLAVEADAEIARLRGLLADRHERGCATMGDPALPCDCGALEFKEGSAK